jgi:hypothetical protein
MIGLWRTVILLAALIGAGQASAAEVIHSFVSDVKVAKDGELTVTEALQVRAEGSAMRHGIYRDFPLTFKDAGGTLREVTFSLVNVSRDGAAEPYHTERTHGVIRIYAGSKDVLIRPGEHTYVFEYRTGRQMRWFDGKPELNWNVTGNFWRFPIESDLPPAAVRRRSAGALDRLHRPARRARHRLARQRRPARDAHCVDHAAARARRRTDRSRRASRDGSRAAQRQYPVLVPNLG